MTKILSKEFRRGFAIFTAILMGASSLFGSMLSFTEVDPPQPPVPFANDILFEENATVNFYEVEGGFYGLVTKSGKNLYPLNLPDLYKSDRLSVYVTYREADTMTFVMWGTPVVLLTIE